MKTRTESNVATIKFGDKGNRLSCYDRFLKSIFISGC